MKSLKDLFKRDSSKSKLKVGLALSGGGTRGFAHVGVIKAFNEQSIHFDCVAGTSAGSLIGAMYCAGVSCEQMIEATKGVTRKDILNSMWAIGSDASNIGELANRLLLYKNFDDLSLPFAAVAVDITSGNEVVLTSGNVARAVSASCAVPALFKPVEINGMLLVDGGLLNNMPADVCKDMGADVVISVDLNHNRGQGTSSRKLKDILLATWSVTTKMSMYKGLQNSDVVIEPELGQFSRASLDNVQEMVDEGYRAAMEKMEEVKQLLHKNK